ncbi:MAG: DUF3419 family protein [Clostridia bacterium]|nr:DUF3419 family protein [Clostridia bacterium]
MFKPEDKKYLNNPDYSMALEKFFFPKYYASIIDNNAVEKVYPSTNEYVEGVFDSLGNLEGQSVVTVGSSGDQMLTAILRGAKDVTLIDANIFTKYFVEYKIAMIKNLTREEFLKRFYPKFTEGNLFGPETFQKIFHDLSPESQEFWGHIFLENLDSYDICKNLIHNSAWLYAKFYTDDEAYNSLQKLLKEKDLNIDFITAEFSDFPKHIKGKHKAILLSNIFDYVDCSSDSGQKSYRKTVSKIKNNNLRKDGVMQVFYNFGYLPYRTLEKTFYKDRKNIVFHHHQSELNPNVRFSSYLMTRKKQKNHINPEKEPFSFDRFIDNIKRKLGKEEDKEYDRD